ncbi:thioredoxin-like protein [Athelia psychrophila]|uniref:Thioredoxin-like protein n=1 Tax=Athelia psychrophila TaxID=1759441 RepID=A0A166VPY2_9AGAM|nr:thioredoxin-like protein [Fibularhizoctonia sp. CBS 109695]
MSNDQLNPRLASLASRLVEPNRDHDEEPEDEEALFAELEAEIENDDSSAMREHGLAVLKQEMGRVKDMQSNDYGRYTEITSEKEVIRASAREPRCVIHFYHTNFKRCEIMDRHLAKLAPKYFTTRFIRVFVESVPWLVEKLMIKVLPCVICFVDGVSTDRLIGFEELGGGETFETATLELRLSMSGVIQKKTEGSTVQTVFMTSARPLRATTREDDEDFDLDD